MNGRIVKKIKRKDHSNIKSRDTSSDWRACKSKIRYRSEGEALHARTKIGYKRDTPLEIYYCGRCNGYHLTKNID